MRGGSSEYENPVYVQPGYVRIFVIFTRGFSKDLKAKFLSVEVL